jgi:hypothetical protein
MTLPDGKLKAVYKKGDKFCDAKKVKGKKTFTPRSCLYAKNQLLAHHFGKTKLFLLALKNIITDMGRIPLFQYN